MSSENKRSRTEDEVENQTPSKKTKDSIDDNAELTAQQKNDDICEDDTSEPQKHKEMKGYKNMGSDIFVSEKIENINLEILNKIDKTIIPKNCQFFFRVKTKTMMDMCKNIKSSNSLAKSIQIIIRPSNEDQEVVDKHSENKFIRKVNIMIHCLNGIKTFLHEGLIRGHTHDDCRVLESDKPECISTTLDEIEKQLKIHSKSVFCYFSTEEQNTEIICIESYDQENNIKKTFFTKNNLEFVSIFFFFFEKGFCVEFFFKQKCK